MCPFCYSLITNAYITKCGHMFCEKCLFESTLYNSNCGLCRKPIGVCSSLPVKVMDKMVTLVSNGLTEEEAGEIRESAKHRSEWANKRFVQKFEKGLKIEVLENPDIWKPATVLEVTQRCDGKQLLKVHYDGWSDAHDEHLLANSRRIVPEGFALSNSSWINRSKTVLAR